MNKYTYPSHTRFAPTTAMLQAVHTLQLLYKCDYCEGYPQTIIQQQIHLLYLGHQ